MRLVRSISTVHDRPLGTPKLIHGYILKVIAWWSVFGVIESESTRSLKKTKEEEVCQYEIILQLLHPESTFRADIAKKEFKSVRTGSTDVSACFLG